MANVLTPAGGIFRRPRGGRPQVIIGQVDHRHISIHALREEGDTFLPTPSQSMSVFLSTPSARRATISRTPHLICHAYFYPRPPRGGRQSSVCSSSMDLIFLSTPSARRATISKPTVASRERDFYPRPPRGGRPCRPGGSVMSAGYFYPRPPRGGRLQRAQAGNVQVQISIHALREEGDRWLRPTTPMDIRFLSTPSARRATVRRDARSHPLDISIHALREEGDAGLQILPLSCGDFYPRPPRGGRPKADLQSSRLGYFYPRPPRGGRLDIRTELDPAGKFLSTPSARRATIFCLDGSVSFFHFYPRPPRGGRLGEVHHDLVIAQFLSTPSARRATACRWP